MSDRSWTASQEAAMNISDKMLLVSAAAGSGKTSVLTERIIRLLTAPNSRADLSRILVVTFTRAAAAELKSRIASALTAALAERPGDPHLTRQLFLLGRAQISTIDAFFQKAVRENFDQLELPASFRLADQGEADELCKRILNDTVQELYDRYTLDDMPSESPFSKLRGNRFARAMDDLMPNRRVADFDSKLLSFYEKFSSYPRGIAILHDYAEALKASVENEFFDSPPGKALHRYLSDATAYFLAQLDWVRRYLEIDPDCNAKFSGVHEYDTSFFTAMKNALAQGSYDAVRQVAWSYHKINFPTMKAKPAEMDRYKDLRTEIKEVAEDWNQCLGNGTWLP